MKLNPGEEVKYGEYWAQAVGENESVGGKDAVSFLGRAAKVSKGQLRRIWDIADHQKEGFLGRDEFYVALRLLALAQRGAELSVAGLRNFSGINLIPNIAPQVKEEPVTIASTGANRNEFSWTVQPTVVAKYDSFFRSLDSNNTGMIDGRQGVTFFGKSGLPRPTLKRIWELADVTRDGMLSLDEFRSAMHMVSSIRNKRLTVTALPSTLDPSGPNWLRVEGEEVPAPPSEKNTSAQIEQAPMQAPDQARVLAPAPPAPGLDKPPPPPQEVGNSGSLRGHPQMVGHALARPDAGYPEPQIPLPAPNPERHSVPTPDQNQEVSNHLSPRSNPLAQSREAEQMREALRRERLEVEKARREMEEMKAEMERLRLEKASLAATPLSPRGKAQLDRSSDAYGQHRSPRVSPAMAGIPGPTSVVSRPRSNSVSPRVLSKPGPVTSPKHATTASAQPSTVIPPTRTEPISLGNDDEDDIWDQPSPKASALPSPFPDTSKTNTTARPEGSVSSDDDDDDFWEGLGAKPTLGSSGIQKPGESKSKGFGGSELDDWAF